jgi:small basic protein (TIGR04137 family)
MSIHKSLKTKSKLVRARNVLTRAERIEVLERTHRWKDGDNVLGLPKTRVAKPKKGGKKKKKKKDEEEGA